MRSIRNKNTNIELILRKELWKKGFRYKLNSKLYGKPDIVLRKYNIAVFCDGDFWHGKNYLKEAINYKPFWKEKIKNNIIRDKTVNKKLKKEGWRVIRFWKSDILKDVNKCVGKIIVSTGNRA